jgi:hypothetical protein
MDGRSGYRPTRRELLGLLGATALTGCSGSGEQTPEDRTLTAAPLPEPTATPRDRRVAGSNSAAGRSLEAPWYERTATTTLSPAGRTVAFHPRPTGLPGLVGGGRFGRPGTPGSPARLVLVLRNTGEEAVSIPHEPVRGRLVAPWGNARVFLLPAVGPAAGEPPGGGGGPDRRWVDGCWRGRPSGGVTATASRTVEVRPGERGSLVYDLVAGPEGPCQPVGSYAFETGFGWAFTIGVWRTDAPGPAITSRFAGTDVPGLPGGGPTAWFHRADPTTPVYLRPSAERVALGDRETTLRLALFNHASTTLVGNPIAYGLLKLHEGTWYHVVPARLPNPEGHIPQGASLEKRFGLRHGAPADRDDLVPVGHLGGGRYAVRFGMHRPGAPRQHAALVDVDAPRLDLSPSPELRVTGRGSENPLGWLDPDDRLFDAIVRATRTDEPADRTVIAEQVMHEPVLRNTLSLFEEGTESVELHTRDYIADRLLDPRATLRVSLRGRAYELFRRDD